MKQYVVDAFAEKIFQGGPAAVIITDEWMSDELMQKIAGENNISETSYAVKEGDNYHIRWFTPNSEINLCGHATLATGFVLFSFYEQDKTEILFESQSGILRVTKKDDLYELDFPGFTRKPYPITDALIAALGGAVPKEAYLTEDIISVFESADEVRAVRPNYEKMKELPDGLGCHITAQGDNGYDCVSRAFFPKLAIMEDPVCGRMHCSVIPYWADQLNKTKLLAFQASPRTATIRACKKGDRVALAGKASLYSEGDIKVD